MTAAPLPPHLALELRLRQVEYNVLGADGLANSAPSSSQLPILLRAQTAQQTVQSVGSSQSSGSSSSSSAAALRRFVQTDFDACRRFLQAQPQPHTLRSAANDDDDDDPTSSSSSTLAPSEQLVLILDAEQSMRHLERVLSQCRELGEKRDAAGAGRLAEYEAFEPVLETLRGKNEGEVRPKLREVEEELLAALGEYQTFVSSGAYTVVGL